MTDNEWLKRHELEAWRNAMIERDFRALYENEWRAPEELPLEREDRKPKGIFVIAPYGQTFDRYLRVYSISLYRAHWISDTKTAVKYLLGNRYIDLRVLIGDSYGNYIYTPEQYKLYQYALKLTLASNGKVTYEVI